MLRMHLLAEILSGCARLHTRQPVNLPYVDAAAGG